MTDMTTHASDEIAVDNWYGPDAATFGDRLAAAREQAGMTQAQLARRLGVKPGTLRAWEQDRSEPRANRLSMIAGLLGVSIMWLLNGEGEGLDGPDDPVLSDDAEAILREMRDVRMAIAKSSDRLAKLEKHLRGVLKVAP